MSSNPYKAFIAYSINKACMPKIGSLPDDIEHYESQDPIGGSWGTVGFVNTFDGQLVCDLSSSRSLMVVQFNDRILPGKVRDEKVKARVAKLQDQEGRKVSKKEYAQLREEIEFELLPKAFIRRSQVPVFFNADGHMLVCTSSQSRADKTVAFLARAFQHLEPWQIQVASPLEQKLTTLAQYGVEAAHRSFTATNAAVLRKGKHVIRVKDREIDSAEVQSLLDDYSVTELAIESRTNQDADVELTFSLNDNFVFKRCLLPDVKASGLKEDQHGFALLCVQTYMSVLLSLVKAFGGAMPKPTDEQPASDEEL